MTFGEKLSLVRKQRTITQSQLGKLVGTSGDMIGKYERDETTPSIDAAKKLADALGVSLDYLAGDKEEPVLDARTQRRLHQVEQLAEEEKQQVFLLLDALLREFHTRRLYEEAA